MKNKKFTTALMLLSIVLLFTSIFQIYGCDSTKGRNLPTSPSGKTLSLSASPTSVAANNIDLSTVTARVTGWVSGTVNFIADMGTLTDLTGTSSGSAVAVNVNSSGEAKVLIKSAVAGTATIIASTANLSSSVGVTFTGGGPSTGLFITSIAANSATSGGATPAEIDIVQGVCGTTDLTAEPFFDDEATVTFSNLGRSLVNITGYKIIYGARDGSPVTIPTYTAAVALTIPSQGTGAITVTIIKAGSTGQAGTKLWYAVQSGIPGTYYTYTASYTFFGTDLAGKSVSVHGGLEIKLGNYNYCDE